MTLQLGALRDALVKAGAGDDLASKAAEEVAAYATQRSTLRADVSVVKWVTALNTALLIAIAL